MAKESVKKHNEFEELVENPDALADRLTQSEDFVKRNKTKLLVVFAAIAALIVAGFLYYNYRSTQNREAQQAMFQAVYYFEADSLSKALEGDGQYEGLLQIADEYSGTEAGNLANFYAGVALLKQGQYEAAVARLQEFESDDYLLQARAYSLTGDALLEQGKNQEAAELYIKAANYNPNPYFSPQYLMKAGIAYEADNNYAAAVEVYEEIITDFVTSAEVADAKKYKARAELLAGGNQAE
ncbi:tetratricopeptide repeat protein [Pontibacter ummariensis]|uniref:Tetratricopeptide repeat-containing protein n=1 Tax=Pontibacter ummariensis TaxID=1610492 RepID=A0A239CGU3_9BACT|nr:tetratricopeptide repeat protein [Pontibacter ummariensis]PRY15034.1 tetratricopeptide repeat protein [Pontibacter ummariensis]SNS19092.1 Tetratricopeptide repeat-containing protein [Pontibacter ummariensis]